MSKKALWKVARKGSRKEGEVKKRKGIFQLGKKGGLTSRKRKKWGGGGVNFYKSPPDQVSSS